MYKTDDFFRFIKLKIGPIIGVEIWLHDFMERSRSRSRSRGICGGGVVFDVTVHLVLGPAGANAVRLRTQELLQLEMDHQEMVGHGFVRAAASQALGTNGFAIILFQMLQQMFFLFFAGAWQQHAAEEALGLEDRLSVHLRRVG